MIVCKFRLPGAMPTILGRSADPCSEGAIRIEFVYMFCVRFQAPLPSGTGAGVRVTEQFLRSLGPTSGNVQRTMGYSSRIEELMCHRR